MVLVWGYFCCKGITQTLIPDTLAAKPKASQSTNGNLLWSVVYISDTVCLSCRHGCQGILVAYPPVTGQGRLNGCGSAKAG
jgi:hypothetical protein